jgi:ribosomal protein L33
MSEYKCVSCGYRMTETQLETIRLDVNKYCPNCQVLNPYWKKVK